MCGLGFLCCRAGCRKPVLLSGLHYASRSLVETEVTHIISALSRGGFCWDNAQLVSSGFVPSFHRSLALGSNGLPNDPILVSSKASEAATYQKRDGHPFNSLGPLRHSWDIPVHTRNAASFASDISSVWVGDGAYHGFGIVLFDVRYSTLFFGLGEILTGTTCSRYDSQGWASVPDPPRLRKESNLVSLLDT